MTAPRTPPVVADVDLQDFTYMPLDVVRLRDSGMAARATGEEFRAAVLLWCASWHQRPAASLPEDDAELAHLAGFGRDQRAWKKVRAGALRGWFLCEDGRLYHEVVAEKANEAWKERQQFAEVRNNDAERKRRERRDREQLFAKLREAGIVPAYNTTTSQLRAMAAGLDQSGNDTEDGHSDKSHYDTGSHDTPTRLRREVKGREGSKELLPPTSAATDTSVGGAPELARALHDVGFPECSGNTPDLIQAKAEGFTAAELRAAAIEKQGKGIPYLVQMLRGRRADAATRGAGSTPTPAAVLDPTVRALRDAEHDRTDKILRAHNDLALGIIDQPVCEQRIADANRAFADLRAQHQGAEA